MITTRTLYSLLRDGISEVQIQGEIVVVDGDRILFQSSDAIGSYPARSLLKPFQFYATGLNFEGNTKIQHIAALGSISANEEQVQSLRQAIQGESSELVLSKIKLPVSFPMDEQHRAKLKSNGMGPEQCFHTCFSKHLAIIESCEKNKWPLDSYLAVDHPFHLNLKNKMEELLKERFSDLLWVTDGCQLPSPVLRLDQMAHLFQLLAEAKTDTRLKTIRNLMLENPDWIGGPERVDSKVISKNAGRVIAKEGADGLLAIGVLPSAEYPRGLGILVKIAAGYLPQSAGLALRPLFEVLGLSSPVNPPAGQNIKFHYKPWVTPQNEMKDISPLLNSRAAVWPGDKSFNRKVALDMNSGSNYTLSSIETTVHIGSHTDAPNHFDLKGKAIHQVDLNKYQGLCQVIEISKPKGTAIKPEDLKGMPVLAKRVLFKTTSFPNPEHFNEDFNALSRELIEYLSFLGVKLVGIDTPSVDLFDSKELPAHLATMKANMAILEGIDLQDIQTGIYELTALPLKLEGLDASPVRAVLIKKD